MELQVNKNDLHEYIEKVVDEFSHDMENLVSEHAQFENLLKRIIAFHILCEICYILLVFLSFAY